MTKTLSALTGPSCPTRAAILRALEAGEDPALVAALARRQTPPTAR